MADADKKFNIEIGTSADTTGLDAVQRGLEAIAKVPDIGNSNPMAMTAEQLGTPLVEEHAQAVREDTEAMGDAQRQIQAQTEAMNAEDVARAKALQGERAQAAQLKELTQIGRALLAMQLAAGLSQTIDKIRTLGEEAVKHGGAFGSSFAAVKPALDAAQTGVDGLATGLSAAVATGNPLLGLLAGIATEVGGVGKAYQGMKAEQKAVIDQQKQMIAFQQHLTDVRNLFVDSIKRQNLANTYAEEGRQLGFLVTQMEAAARVQAARDNLADVQGKSASAQAARTGGNTGAVDANNAASGLAAQLSALDQKLELNKAQAAQLQLAADEAADKLQLAREDHTSSNEDLNKLSQDLAAARAKVKDNEVDSAALTEEVGLQKQALIEGTAEQFRGLQEGVSAKATEDAKAAMELIKAEADKHGGDLSQTAQTAFANLAKIIGDNIPDGQQTAEIATQMSNLRTSTEAKDKAVYEGLSALIARDSYYAGQFRALNQKIEALRLNQ